jgi:hypothetical protein
MKRLKTYFEKSIAPVLETMPPEKADLWWASLAAKHPEIAQVLGNVTPA